MNEIEIDRFWSWFCKNKDELKSDCYTESAFDYLDKTIVTEWLLDWEIGPGKTKENSLAISPMTDPERLTFTNLIISKAPLLDDWEFYSSKQAKENWHLLNLPAENISIDASEWTYILLKYEDEKMMVLVKADNLKPIDKETTYLIVELVLINLLGEEVFMQTVDFFDTTDEFESDKGITEIKHLPEHIKITVKDEHNEDFNGNHN